MSFNALKQNVKVKTIVATSEDAVKTQVSTAPIAILPLKSMQLKSTFDWSLSNLGAMLRFNLPTYRYLWALLNAPYLSHNGALPCLLGHFLLRSRKEPPQDHRRAPAAAGCMPFSTRYSTNNACGICPVKSTP